jgi:hypothetical protein
MYRNVRFKLWREPGLNDIWQWYFTAGDAVCQGHVETPLELVAVRRVKREIDRELARRDAEAE